MIGYLRVVSDKYKVGEKYTIDNENCCFGDGITIKDGFYYVFDRLDDCVASTKDDLADILEVELLSYSFCHGGHKGKYYEGKEILVKKKIT